VITSKANNDEQLFEKIAINGGKDGFKIWLKEVTGYNKNDPDNGYAGVLGKPITGLRINGGQKYRAHILAGNKWLEETTGNNLNEYETGFTGTVDGEV